MVKQKEESVPQHVGVEFRKQRQVFAWQLALLPVAIVAVGLVSGAVPALLLMAAIGAGRAVLFRAPR